jgi:glycosyltransferase involved in cell wall biosynthesis
VSGVLDIALVSLGTTLGLRQADEAFAAQLRAAGASCEVFPVQLGRAPRLRRTMALTDAVEAVAARAAARGTRARVHIYSSVTAGLLQPPRTRTAVRFDSIAAVNRPGMGGAWQRRRERSLLRSAGLLLPWSEQAADAARRGAGLDPAGMVVLPPPVATATATAITRDRFEAVAYAANPHKRGLDLLARAWSLAGPRDARLAVGGLDRTEGERWLRKLRVAETPRVVWLGSVDPERWRAIVAGARVFVSAARFEDWGIAQMEALAAGVPLVTVPAGGANPALALARQLAPELVAVDRSCEALAGALTAGLELDGRAREAYGRVARRLLEPYRDDALRRRVSDEVLPRLLSSSR